MKPYLASLKEEWEEKCLDLSYKHDNEITLAIDDMWKWITKALKEQRKTVSERIGKMKLKKRSENDLTMYLGYGVPEIDYRVGYNQAIDNILEHL